MVTTGYLVGEDDVEEVTVVKVVAARQSDALRQGVEHGA